MLGLLELVGWGGVLTGVAAPVLAYLAVWPPLTSYQALRTLVLVAGGLTATCVLLAVRALRRGEPPGPPLSACSPALVVLGVAAGLVLPRWAVPSLDDVTTTPVAAPHFERVGAAAGADYPAGRAALLREAHPDLVPVPLQLTVPQALRRIESGLRGRSGWTLVAVEPQRGRLEATVVSAVFRFVHDIVVEVRPTGQGSEVHVRGRARQAPPDCGETAGLVRDVLTEVRSRS